MKCPNCGKQVAEGKKFCGFCGQKLTVVAPAAIPPTSAKEVAATDHTQIATASKKATRKPGWVIPLVLVIVAIIIVVVLLMRQEPTSTSESSGEVIAIAGNWIGNNTENASYCTQLEIEVKDRCSVGDICGYYQLSNTDVFGDLKLIGLENGTYLMQEIPMGPSDFEGTGYESLTLKGDVLDYAFEGVSPSGEKVISSSCTLSRK